MKVIIGYTGEKKHNEILAKDIEIVEVKPSWGSIGSDIVDLCMSIKEIDCPYFISHNQQPPCDDVVSGPFDYECVMHSSDDSFQCPHLMKLSYLGGKYFVSCSGGKCEE